MSVLIAIDGPAGSGKTTLARGLSRRLGLPYVNTGMMYRAVTQRALQAGADLANGPALAELAATIPFSVGGEEPGTLFIDGTEPSGALQAREVEAHVSTVARHPEVRAIMRELQRVLGAQGAVMEGRDIGSVVFPDATVKFFLVAAPDTRAARRIEERGGGEDLGEALAARDAKDSRVNPFVPPEDAVVIDNTGKGIDEVLEEALAVVRSRT